MILLRHSVGMVRSLAAYTVRSGRWWLPVVLLLWLVVGLLVATAHVVVPTTVYTLF